MINTTKRVDELGLEAQVTALTKALEHVVTLSKKLERERQNSRIDRNYCADQFKMLKIAWKGLVSSGLEDYNKDLKDYMTGL